MAHKNNKMSLENPMHFDIICFLLPSFRRVHLLRPYTKVESIHMPTAIEQRGIHLVLPVKKNETELLEEFLQMYQKVCLQTGENVVLLTVFVNVKDGSSDEATTDKFSDGKALVSR